MKKFILQIFAIIDDTSVMNFRNKLTKLGRCDSSTIELANDSNANIVTNNLGLQGEQARTARTSPIPTMVPVSK